MVPVQMWVRGGVGPGANVGWYEPSPVVSDERSPKTQMRACRTKLRCAAHTLRCNGCRCVQLPVKRCIGAVHCCRLRRDATSSACPVGPTLGVLKDHSRGALGRCNRLRCDATGNNAAMQQAMQWCGGRGTPVCVPVCADERKRN